MNDLVWNDSLSIHNQSIDKQHKILFGIVNILVNIITEPDSHETLDDILTLLEKYANTHFTTEENYMVAVGYKNLESHRSQHEYFRKKIHDFKSKFNRGEVHIKLEAFVFLKDWLVNHVSVVDQELLKYAAN